MRRAQFTLGITGATMPSLHRFTLGCRGSFTSWRTPQARCLPCVRPPIPARLQQGRRDQTIGQGIGPRVLGARRNVCERETPTSRRTAGSDPADLRRDPLSVFAPHRERSVRAVLRPLRSASQVSTAARSAWPPELVAVMDGQGSPWWAERTSLEQHRAQLEAASLHTRLLRCVPPRELKGVVPAPTRGVLRHLIERVSSGWAVTGAEVDDHQGAALWQQPPTCRAPGRFNRPKERAWQIPSAPS